MMGRRAPYGRQDAHASGNGRGRHGATGFNEPYQGETYYGHPVIKASPYGWLIITYFFVGGIAGGAQLIAALVDLVGNGRDRMLVRTGRYVALVGALVSPVLLILDLHYQRRWYNMLRIFRPTSAMSIGSWTVAAFGTMTGLTALGQMIEDLTGAAIGRKVARIFSLPAALLGAMMSVYTGVLLAATSVPLWASVYRLLPALFGASAVTSAAATLSLLLDIAGAPARSVRKLRRVELAAGAVELLAVMAVSHKWKEEGVAAPVHRPPVESVYYLGAVGLGMVFPLAVHTIQTLTGRHSRLASRLAAIASLTGIYLERAVVVLAGNESARRPTDYFRFTQPKNLDEYSPAAAFPSLRSTRSQTL